MEKIITSYYENNAKKLHNLIDNILFKLRFEVDHQDFYSLGNEIFVDVIKRYDTTKDFDAFLYSCLLNKFKTEMTRRNRKKRQADKNSISIYVAIDEDENLTLLDIIADQKNTVENILFCESEDTYSIKMRRYLNRLSVTQREVLQLISAGFDSGEIIKELGINKKQYEDCYNAIHSYKNISILL